MALTPRDDKQTLHLYRCLRSPLDCGLPAKPLLFQVLKPGFLMPGLLSQVAHGREPLQVLSINVARALYFSSTFGALGPLAFDMMMNLPEASVRAFMDFQSHSRPDGLLRSSANKPI
jgi:hypothetical protein